VVVKHPDGSILYFCQPYIVKECWRMLSKYFEAYFSEEKSEDETSNVPIFKTITSHSNLCVMFFGNMLRKVLQCNTLP
jgi:hypothetical protein